MLMTVPAFPAVLTLPTSRSVGRSTAKRTTGWCALLGISLFSPLLSAQEPQSVSANTERADKTIQAFLDREIAKEISVLTARGAGSNETSRLAPRVDVVVGEIDRRLQLAPCQRIEPYLPANTRFAGRVNLMLRCIEGANWNVTLPVTVRIFGHALVTTRSLSTNEVVQPTDVQPQEVELSRDPGTAVTGIGQLEQRLLTRPVAAGTVLRQEWFRVQPVIAAGDMIKVIATGNGFTVTSDGQALNPATEGQTVRIKTESGRVISGTARSGRIAEIRL